MLNIYEIADKYVRDKYKYLSKRSWKNEMAYDKALFIKAAELVQKEYEEKLRFIPVEEKLPEGKLFEPNQSHFRQSEDIELKLNSSRITVGYYDISTDKFIYQDSDFDKVVGWRYFYNAT